MRVSEIYLSIQGEGPRVGIPTVFVRFGGCNLRCPGWPCDTQHAIDLAFRNEWKEMTPDEVVREIISVADSTARNVCLTGGEPYLQRDAEMERLVNLLWESCTIEAFSNGMRRYGFSSIEHVNFVLDWKLPGSGEVRGLDTREGKTRQANYLRLSPTKDVLKFTIADAVDYEYAKDTARYLRNINPIPVIYGVVWGVFYPADLIRWVLADGLDWRYTMQVHNVVWDRTQRGI